MTPDSHPSRRVDDEGSRLVIAEDGLRAELTYRLRGEGLTLLHVGVPPAIEGRGIGGELVHAAVQRAAAEGLTITPRCSFARHWLRQHSDLTEGVPIDWAEPTARAGVSAPAVMKTPSSRSWP